MRPMFVNWSGEFLVEGTSWPNTSGDAFVCCSRNARSLGHRWSASLISFYAPDDYSLNYPQVSRPSFRLSPVLMGALESYQKLSGLCVKLSPAQEQERLSSSRDLRMTPLLQTARGNLSSHASVVQATTGLVAGGPTAHIVF